MFLFAFVFCIDRVCALLVCFCCCVLFFLKCYCCGRGLFACFLFLFLPVGLCFVVFVLLCFNSSVACLFVVVDMCVYCFLLFRCFMCFVCFLSFV